MSFQSHHFEIFADYFQFYLCDEALPFNIGENWNPADFERFMLITKGNIFVGTVRNMTVPVDIEIHTNEPAYSLDEWDQVNECSAEITSGRMVIAGCTDYFPDAARIEIAPGTYRARIFYGNLDALSDDGLEGDDYYRVALWPGTAIAPTVLKQWPFAANRAG